MLNFGDGQKIVVVLSGGIDSSVLLHAALKAEKEVSIFHGYYNKPSSDKEMAFAKWAAQNYRVPIEIVDLSGITSMQIGYVDPIQIAADEADMKAEELNNENAISGFHTLISAAAYFTQITSHDSLALGLIREQADKRPELEGALDLFSQFLEKLNPLGPSISFHSPLIRYAKADVIALGWDLKVPFEKTWSCSSATQSTKHCGVCAQCQERKSAFVEARVEDPTPYIE